MMDRLREVLARLKNLFRRTRQEEDMRAELEFHLQMDVQSRLHRGHGQSEARRHARLQAGSVSSALDEMRDERRFTWLEGTITDLRQSAGALRRNRGFAVVAISALAVAVATNTLIFTLFNGVLLKGLPYPNAERLVRLFEATPRYPKFPVSIGNYLELRRNVQSFEGIGLYTRGDLQLMHGDHPEQMASVRVTADFFPTLGITPMLGRNFTESEMRGEPRVVILSNRLWQSRFDGNPQIIGQTIRLNRQDWTVIGVLPAGFQHIGGAFRSPLQGDTVALWWPLRLDLPGNGQRAWHFTNAVARLKPDSSIAQAREEMKSVSSDLRQRFPDWDDNLNLQIFALKDEVVGSSRETILLLAAAGALVLLIACVNVAGLCVARSLARRKEMAVREALGAGKWRVWRVLLCENLVLGVAGGVAGLLLAIGLSPVWRAVLPQAFPRVHEAKLSYAAAIFAFLAGIATSLLAGLAPALRLTRRDVVDHLNQESRGASHGRESNRLRMLLVAGEAAFAAVLCAAAVLLVHSALRLGARSHGFSPQGVLIFSLSLPVVAYEEQAQRARFYEALAASWRNMPGVQAAGLSTDVPWTGHDENSGFGIPGRANERGGGGHGRYHMATAGYFEALHIPLLDGRNFNEADGAPTAPKVVLVNDSLARRYFAGEKAVGKMLDLWGARRQIVGIVGDIQDRPAGAIAEPAFWFPVSQQNDVNMFAVIRTDGDPLALLPSATRALREMDRELPAAEARSMDDVVGAAMAELSLANWLFQIFAGLALLLAAFGIYGLLSYVVEQRRKEFGIRKALGAMRKDIVWLVVKDGALQAGGGGLVGVLAAPVAGRFLSSLLYGVTATDVLPLLVVPAIMLLVSVASSIVPAIAAARTEAATILRAE
jgi:macrolide transport system ATP-binding/permease protein